jgi:hypothetical protein
MVLMRLTAEASSGSRHEPSTRLSDGVRVLADNHDSTPVRMRPGSMVL